MTVSPALAAVVGTSRPPEQYRSHESVCRRLAGALPVDRLRLATGACGGFPDALAGAFYALGGHVTGYSPGKDLADHLGPWSSPAQGYSELRFGFGGLIEREIAMLRDADFVIALGGNVGTLSELCMAVKLERPLLIVDGLPGAGAGFPAILAELDPYPAPRVRCVPPETFAEAVLEQVRDLAA